MHQALAEAGLPIIRQICTTDPEEVAAWIAREGLAGQDLVIKPTTSAGTVGVSRAPGGEGWRERFTDLLGTYDKLGVVAEDVLVQEHMTGTEYAIDTVSHHGRHSITDIIKYRRIPYGEGIAVYDSVEWLPYDTERARRADRVRARRARRGRAPAVGRPHRDHDDPERAAAARGQRGRR